VTVKEVIWVSNDMSLGASPCSPRKNGCAGRYFGGLYGVLSFPLTTVRFILPHFSSFSAQPHRTIAIFSVIIDKFA
jgi:hypothetical protein